MKALILAGGSCPKELFLSAVRELGEDPFLVAADGGGRLFWETGVIPDLLVGDLDSLTLQEREEFTRLFPTERLQPEKDDTDLEHAVERVLEKGPEEVILLGATGTRLDHTLTGIRLLERFFAAGVPAQIRDEHNRITLREGTFRISRKEQYGKYISVLPLDREVRVSMKGFFYPAENLLLKRCSSRGVSNELKKEEGEITADGPVLLMETKD